MRSRPRAHGPELGAALHRCLRTDSLVPLEPLGLESEGAVTEFVAAATYHRLDAFVLDLPAPPDSSEALLEALRQLRMAHLVRRAALISDLLWLQGVLAESRAPWISLKGLVTAERHYSRPAQRSFSDLDVLVPPGRFQDVVERLSAAGARVIEENWALVRRLGCGELNLVLPRGTLLDLHWSIVAAPHDRRAFSIVPEEMIERQVVERVAGTVDLPAADRTDELVHLCLHAVLGGTNSLGRHRDVVLASAAFTDWPELVQRSRAWGVGLPVAVALERSPTLFQEPVPSAPFAALTDDHLWRLVVRRLGRAFPETSAPPVTRRSSHLKLTRRTTSASLAYSASEVGGYLLRGVVHRSRDDWDQRVMQRPDDDVTARAAFFADVTAEAASP